MGRIATPLSQMGASIVGETAPVTVQGAPLHSIEYMSPVASAQIKSAVLLAGLQAEGVTRVDEPSPSRDHTERMLKALGVQVETEGTKVSIAGGQSWALFEMTVPGDISSAAFWFVAALTHPGSEVWFEDLGVNPSRTGILDLANEMFGSQSPLCIESTREELGEPVCRLGVRTPSYLPAFRIEGALVPKLIDEIPVLAVLATQCQGTTTIRDAQELRVKETDRIAVVCRYLAEMGADIQPTPDGMIINGPTPLTGTAVDSAGDHRIGMAFAIAGSLAQGETQILNADAIDTSYPEFVEHFESLTGVKIQSTL